jgi:hypothetical protein
METFLEWLNQRDPEYLFESAFAEQNSELIEETFGRRMGGRPIIAPRVNRPIIARRPIFAPKRSKQSYAPVNRGYTQGGTRIPNMDPVTGRIIPDDVSPSTVDQADNRREPQQLDISALLGSNISNIEKQNRIKKFIADDLQGDLMNADQDDIDSIVFAISDGILDDDIIPSQVALELKNTANKFRVREELEKLTKTPHQRQLDKLIKRADAATKQFPPR